MKKLIHKSVDKKLANNVCNRMEIDFFKQVLKELRVPDTAIACKNLFQILGIAYGWQKSFYFGHFQRYTKILSSNSDVADYIVNKNIQTEH